MDRKPCTSASPDVALNCSNTLGHRSQYGRPALNQIAPRYRIRWFKSVVDSGIYGALCAVADADADAEVIVGFEARNGGAR